MEMKTFYLSLAFLICVVNGFGQNLCNCKDTLTRELPVFQQFSDSTNSLELSMDYFTQYLNENISRDGLDDNVFIYITISIGPDGKFCDILYDNEPSSKAKEHIEDVLKMLPAFKNNCFELRKTIVLDEYIKAGEPILKAVGKERMPVFNGCPRLTNDSGLDNCTYHSLKKHIQKHPLYPKLQNFEDGTCVVDFVITTEGKTTLFNVKSGKCEGKENIIKQIVEDMPLWSPGITSKNKKVNILYRLPVR